MAEIKSRKVKIKKRKPAQDTNLEQSLANMETPVQDTVPSVQEKPYSAPASLAEQVSAIGQNLPSGIAPQKSEVPQGQAVSPEASADQYVAQEELKKQAAAIAAKPTASVKVKKSSVPEKSTIIEGGKIVAMKKAKVKVKKKK